MNSSDLLLLIQDHAIIEHNYVVGRKFVVHPSLKKGKRVISTTTYWALYTKCDKLGINIIEENIQ